MNLQIFFTEELSYGEHTIDYGVDENGSPVARYRDYASRSRGFVILEPGPLENEEVRETTFATIREAAWRLNKEAFFDVNESNWKALTAQK